MSGRECIVVILELFPYSFIRSVGRKLPPKRSRQHHAHCNIWFLLHASASCTRCNHKSTIRHECQI